MIRTYGHILHVHQQSNNICPFSTTYYICKIFEFESWLHNMQWVHHNGPTVGSARVEVDNGAIENVLRVYERGAEKATRQSIF